MSLPYAILGLLNYDSMTGYDIKKMFDESINNFWAASLSQIYRELGTLENKGYLTSVIQQQHDRPDKRIYSITEAGKTEFRYWITNFPQSLSKETRDEFTLRIFFGSYLSKEELIKQFQRFINEKLKHMEELKVLYEMSEKYAKEIKLFNGEETYLKFVLRRAELTLETLIDWANECIDELNKQISKGCVE
jgi:DNA-binding PadR family transcriptional regulator